MVKGDGGEASSEYASPGKPGYCRPTGSLNTTTFTTTLNININRPLTEFPRLIINAQPIKLF